MNLSKTSRHRDTEISRRMRAVRRQGTEPERRLQFLLRRERLYFRTHVKVIKCHPDIVFSRLRVAVFVDGDFWHGRVLVESGPSALANSFRGKSQRFWIDKIQRNVARDRQQIFLLRRHGWAVLRFWGKDVLRDPEYCATQIVRRLQARRVQFLKCEPDAV